MNAASAPPPVADNAPAADRFVARYGVEDSFWEEAERRWMTDSDEHRIALAPANRIVKYTGSSNPNSLTVTWKDGSAILVSYLGTEDETWDYADAFPRIRGFRFGPTPSAQSS